MSKGGRGSKPITDCVVTSFEKENRTTVSPGRTPSRLPADSTLEWPLLEESVSLTELVLGCEAVSTGLRNWVKVGDSLASTRTLTLAHSDG